MGAIIPYNLTSKKIVAAESLTRRAPTITDDTTAGFIVGSIWRNTSTLEEWTAVDVTAGAACWQKNSVIYFPIVDAVTAVANGAGPIAAYGNMQLTTAYAGNLRQILRASDSTTLDIPQLANGSANVALEDAFLERTTGGYSKWYDQSGNANDATQGTAANQPPVAYNLIGGQRALTFPAAGIGNDYKMTMPAGVAVTTDSFSFLMICRLGNAPSSGNVFVDFGTNNTGSTDFGFWGLLPTGENNVRSAATNDTFYGFNNSGPIIPSNDLFFGVTSSNPTHTIYAGENSGTIHVMQHASSTGGTIGAYVRAGSTTSYNGRFDVLALIIYNRVLSTAEIAAAKLATYRMINKAPENNLKYIALGDSRTAGTAALLMADYPRYIQGLLSQTTDVLNMGYPGVTLQTIAANLTPATFHNSSYKKNVWSLMAGVNDVTAGRTSAQMYADMTTIINAVHAVGDPIIVCTDPTNGNFTSPQQTTHDAFNVLVKANAAGADLVVDLAASSLVGTVAATSNTTYFYTDKLHLRPPGLNVIAALLGPQVDAFLNS